MDSTYLLHHLPFAAGERNPEAPALTHGDTTRTYGHTTQAIRDFAAALASIGLTRGERVAVYLEKRLETVTGIFGTSAAGGVFVPVNPILKPDQVAYILRNCNVRILITSPARLGGLREALADCHDLRHIILTEAPGDMPDLPGVALHGWPEPGGHADYREPRIIDTDMAAILYTSGSTGGPKGVVLSHRNMVMGAKSVAQYLENHADDTLLAALPLSFDAGFSQLTTAFHAGARVVLLNYLLPRDVLKALVRERVTGLTAVPPLWIQLTQQDWPEGIDEHLRYIANTGGRMPLATLRRLRDTLPRTRPYLMYGLTEAFRATYLPPEEVDRRPDSIGKAIPNAEVLVLREDGSPCAPNEPGELVQRGALVAQGYWNDPDKTARHFRPLPALAPGRESGLVLPEIAVFSGDTVRYDEDGYLYFIGRRDEMIKTSGYRVSPTEVEEILYATRLVGECVAFGIPDDTLGQIIAVIATPPTADTTLDVDALLAQCKARMPAYMVPARIHAHDGPLPRNPNGKLDRKALAGAWSAKASDNK
ncbi:acyl-CoA ligase (AMP-forming), exosortase A system-associated [Ectothiorhodospira shaposhnikovii]|uniref:acyl-CoA ligase (AMP-forming), exosortase A system-associated n=1 Tax=Ectothiorhodospira shaposhnikovii TaxID=1054 RepID=UPI001EE8D72C|nr:acyl-CoA ligase (AMP-forming), exosortase A system-associated [Ectothiorhodospira shaposhnikovii]MCG5512067.1 acyl-CoA ligase (AMP-forming), exosortase A system-associated [Ectothiorhodospira shaposhnikovii]